MANMAHKLKYNELIDILAPKVTNPKFKVNLGKADAAIYIHVLKVIIYCYFRMFVVLVF